MTLLLPVCLRVCSYDLPSHQKTQKGGPYPILSVVPVIITAKQHNTTLTKGDFSLEMVHTIFYTVKQVYLLSPFALPSGLFGDHWVPSGTNVHLDCVITAKG